MSSVEIYRHYEPESRIKWLNVKDSPPSMDDNCAYLCYTDICGYPWWAICLFSNNTFYIPGEECESESEACFSCEERECRKTMPVEWYVPLHEHERPKKGVDV
jgi:hypothetical protein